MTRPEPLPLDGAHQHFDLLPFYRWVFLVSPWVGLAMTIGSAMLPTLGAGGGTRYPDALPTLALLLGTLFGGLTVLGFGMALRLPSSAISIDDEGLWPTRRRRASSLVRWSDIARFRDRPLLQRLELLDRTGRVLARLEYQLEGFGTLRRIVVERTGLANPRRTVNGVHALPRSHHALHIGAMAVVAVMGLVVGPVEPLTGYVILGTAFAMIAHEYLRTPHRLRIMRGMLIVSWPMRRRIIRRDEVENVVIGDHMVRGRRVPALALSLSGETTPFILDARGMPTTELLHRLDAWRSHGP